MISLEEALRMAKEERDNLDMVVEYEKGYVFSSKDDEGYVGGSGHTPVVILKDGTRSTMAEFMFGDPGEEVMRKGV